MREQFFSLLKEHQFIEEGTRSTDLAVNQNSSKIKIVRAVLTSGLYPNVAQAKINRRMMNTKIALKMCTAQERTVSVHPKCVIDKDRNFTSPWFVYKEKIKSKQVWNNDILLS